VRGTGFSILCSAVVLALSAGCLPVRETRQKGIEGRVLDRLTLRPIAHATLLVSAEQTARWGSGEEYRRYETDADGRLAVPEARAWTLSGIGPGDILNALGAADAQPPRDWVNAHTYLAPGYAWIRLRVAVDSRARPPQHVMMTPLPPTVPRLELGEAAGRHWRSDTTWEIALPACGATAQGLREGGGVILAWDARRVITAPTLHAVQEGLWLESPGEARGVRIVEGSRAQEGRRAFFDARSCDLRLER
jgi:hypothetical protein